MLHFWAYPEEESGRPSIDSRRSRRFSRFAAIAKIFSEILRTKSISHIFRTSRATRRQNLSLLRCLATPEMSKKRFGKIRFFCFQKSVFRDFSWILAELDDFRRQNQIPHAILLQIYRFSALSDPQSLGGKGSRRPGGEGVQQLCLVLKLEHFGPDDIICQEGHFLHEMFFINSGHILFLS